MNVLLEYLCVETIDVVCYHYTDENIQSRVKRHKARQAAGRPKKETVWPKKETVLTVEPSVNFDGHVSKVCTIRKYYYQWRL